MDTLQDEGLLAGLKLAEKRPSRGDSVLDKEPATPPAEVPQSRRRCRLVGTATTDLESTAESQGTRKTDDGRTVKFVPRPAVPTLSKAEMLLKQAEDISVRGNPCISSRKAQNQLLVRMTYVVSDFYYLTFVVSVTL